MALFNNQVIARIEGLTSGLLQRLTDSESPQLRSMLYTKPRPGILKWLSTQLAKQKKTDFKPRNDDISQMGMNTDACNLCCLSVRKAYDTAKENLSGANQEVFLMEIGVGFQGSVKSAIDNVLLISRSGYCWNI